jgi:hypothetical protein
MMLSTPCGSDAVRTIVVDANYPHWQADVEEAVIAGHEVELIHYTPDQEDECTRLADWLRIEFLISEGSQTARFLHTSAGDWQS